MRFASTLPIGVAMVFSVVALALPLGACRDDEGGECNDYTPPATFDPRTPTVSFARDVMPIFAQSCAFTSCHGAMAGSANGVFLGGNDPDRVHQAIVDVPSGELPTMAFVKAGAPPESYLLRKMDGSQCALDARCTGGDCGDSMPKNDALLPVETRDVLRRWIAQGALND